MAQGLEAAGIQVDEASIVWLPKNTVEVTDKEKAQQILGLVAYLEDHDDVQSVSSNYEIPDDLIAEIET
ncbi:MAG: YebC/PmpR family DNA-binding transcriptional regulator [Anaerolineae bacterium]